MWAVCPADPVVFLSLMAARVMRQLLPELQEQPLSSSPGPCFAKALVSCRRLNVLGRGWFSQEPAFPMWLCRELPGGTSEGLQNCS